MVQVYIKKLILLIGLVFLVKNSFAQNNPRYLAFSLINLDHRSPQIVDIHKAADLGMNAFIVSIRKDVIVGKKVSPTNPWQQYDDQIAAARSRGMKICFRIVFATWCNNKTVGDPLDNNVPTCNGFNATERMLGIDTKGLVRVHQQSFGYTGCDLIDDCGQMMTTSLSSSKTIQEMQDFTLQVLQHYKSVIDAGEVIYCSAVITPEQEFGFPFFTTKGLDGAIYALFDYSQSMILSFREWLKVKYENDFAKLKTAWGSYANTFANFNTLEPPKPNGQYNWTVFLLGQAGNDWYTYRHKVLKDYSIAFTKTIKGFNSNLKVINDYGSLNDQPTVQRGTFAFKDIGEGTDGVKMNSNPYQDHRFIMDVARSNFKDKWIMMEVEAFKDRTDLQENHFTEAFTHGAKLVGAFNFDVLNNPAHQDLLRRMTDKFIRGNQQVEKIETCGTTISSVYELLEDGGCAYQKANPTIDCRSYRDWANLKKVNGDKPVNVILDESFITGKPLKLSSSELSVCGSIANFKEIYATECQKVGNKPKASENLKGMIESTSCDKIMGWAINTQNLDEIQTIDIYVDSVKIGTTQANIGNRPDLVTTFNNPKANFRGFSFLLPDTAWYKSGQAKRIYARFANTNTLLEDSGDLKILACEGLGSGICGAKYRLIISPDSLTNVLTKATDYKISVSSNTKWQISKNVNWLTTSTDTGSYNGNFTLKITANADTGTRKGKVTLTAGNLVKSISIAQKGVGQPYLTVSPDSIITITSNGAEYRIVVNSNVKITLSKDAKWITATEGEVGSSFPLKIEQNPDSVTRKGKLILTGQGIKKVFNIVQKGKGQACIGCNGTIDTDKPVNDPNDIAGQIAPTTYRGWVEDVTCCRIKGWAFDSQNFEDNLTLDIYLDKEKIGTTIANLGYRTDLAFNYQSDKLLYKAFCFPMPKSALDSFRVGKTKQLYVRFGGTITKLFSPEPRILLCNPGQFVCPEGENCEEKGFQDYLEVAYPNPSKGIFKLSLYSLKNQTATLKLVDSGGNQLKNISYNLVNGMNNIEVDASDLKNGALLLSISLENGNSLFKRLIKIE